MTGQFKTGKNGKNGKKRKRRSSSRDNERRPDGPAGIFWYTKERKRPYSKAERLILLLAFAVGSVASLAIAASSGTLHP